MRHSRANLFVRAVLPWGPVFVTVCKIIKMSVWTGIKWSEPRWDQNSQTVVFKSFITCNMLEDTMRFSKAHLLTVGAFWTGYTNKFNTLLKWKLPVSGRLCGQGWCLHVLHRVQLQVSIPGRGCAGSGDPGPFGVSPVPLHDAPSLPLALLHRPLQDHLPLPPLQLPGELKYQQVGAGMLIQVSGVTEKPLLSYRCSHNSHLHTKHEQASQLT